MKQPADVKTATAGGMLFVIAGNLTSGDLFKTVVLAAVGAATSFVTALVLKRLSRRNRE
jgi:hypothetical protein